MEEIMGILPKELVDMDNTKDLLVSEKTKKIYYLGREVGEILHIDKEGKFEAKITDEIILDRIKQGMCKSIGFSEFPDVKVPAKPLRRTE
jgi:hypothetical protein